MKPFLSQRIARAALMFLVCAPLAHALPQKTQQANPTSIAPPMDPPSFAAELRRLQGVIAQNQTSAPQIDRTRTSLPEKWDVNTADGDFPISSRPLASLLLQAEQEPAQRAALIHEANSWLDDEAREVESYAASASPSDARAALAQILSRREYRGVRTASAQEIFQRKVEEWLGDIIDWFAERIGRHATSAKIFFELLLLAAVVWLGAVLVRFWMRRARFDELRAPPPVAVDRSWQEWIRSARAASDRGDFREAVHSAYWAGISYLETSDLIDADRTRTPREYVRLLSRQRPGIAAPLEKPRAALAALTARLEVVWYGHRPASREDFADALRQIEGLGCQLP